MDQNQIAKLVQGDGFVLDVETSVQGWRMRKRIKAKGKKTSCLFWLQFDLKPLSNLKAQQCDE